MRAIETNEFVCRIHMPALLCSNSALQQLGIDTVLQTLRLAVQIGNIKILWG